MPNKKVFDVVPPKEGKIQEPVKESKKEKVVLKKKTIKERKPIKFPKIKFSGKKTSLYIIAGIMIVMLSGWLFIKSKAEIQIWPETEVLQKSTEVIVYAGETSEGDIEGEILEVSKNVSQEFESSSQKLKTGKASGTITVYNAYSTNVQTLIANTRFVSGDGKLFRSQERVDIPKAYYQGGEMVPGTIEIEVVADQSGDEYNIGPSTFSLPGLAGTAAYTSIYAKSFQSMTGGVSKEVPQITEGDLEGAEAELTIKALKESADALADMLPNEEDYIILEGAIDQEITQFTSTGKVGEELAKFSAEAKSKSKAMVFKKSYITEFAKNYLLSFVPVSRLLNEGSLNVEYEVDELSLEDNIIKLTLNISCETYPQIDETNIKETMKDKNPEAMSRILKDLPQIEKAQIDLWPFWAKKSPNDSERINIEIVLD